MDEESEERLLKILSNPIRATIVRNLYKDKLSFTHLMQITECKTGQLSFHLRKLDYLVEQDELKRYNLSDKGIKDVAAILPHLSKVEHDVSEEEIEVGFAFKLFVESLVHLMGSCIFAVKYFITHSCKYLVGICSRGFEYLKNRIAKSSSHFDIIKIFWQRAIDNMRLFSKRLSKMTNETVKSLKSLVIVIVKSTKCSMNPMFSYSLMVIGLMLFVPAAFMSVNPQFDSLSNSVADMDVGRSYISIDQMAQANQFYEMELLPNQQHYQHNSNSTLYESMNYIYKFGYPITPETIDTWRNEYAKRKIQYIAIPSPHSL
ncbi:MAG TPA: transcriptional regulator [Methanosarcinaceae archaeon]|nr:transcriptional regulator [Methanosarcinaceae archaeon]